MGLVLAPWSRRKNTLTLKGWWAKSRLGVKSSGLEIFEVPEHDSGKEFEESCQGNWRFYREKKNRSEWENGEKERRVEQSRQRIVEEGSHHEGGCQSEQRKV